MKLETRRPGREAVVFIRRRISKRSLPGPVVVDSPRRIRGKMARAPSLAFPSRCGWVHGIGGIPMSLKTGIVCAALLTTPSVAFAWTAGPGSYLDYAA